MEADTALVRAESRVVLDAVAVVHLHLILVVGPGHAEFHGAFGNHDAFEDAVLFVLGFLVEKGLHGEEHFFGSLKVFGLVGILGTKAVHNALYVAAGHFSAPWRNRQGDHPDVDGFAEYLLQFCNK